MWQTVLSEIDHTHSPHKMHTGLEKRWPAESSNKRYFCQFLWISWEDGMSRKLKPIAFFWDKTWKKEYINEIDQCASTRRNPVLTKCSDLWWKKGCVTLEKAPGEYLVYKIYGVFPWDSLYFMGQYLSFSYFCKSLLFYLSLQYVDILSL